MCTVQISTLRAAPFNYVWGDSIYARISATNIVGTSLFSTDGNGAIFLTNPDAPTSLANNAAITAATQIGLTWSAGAANGGAPVIDFRLTFDQGTGTWVTYASGI